MWTTELSRAFRVERAGPGSGRVGTAGDHDQGGTPMSTVRGRGRSLEIAVDRALAAAVDELREQFAARPDFYRGSRAVAEPRQPRAAGGRDRGFPRRARRVRDHARRRQRGRRDRCDRRRARPGLSRLPRRGRRGRRAAAAAAPARGAALRRGALAGRRLRRRARRHGAPPAGTGPRRRRLVDRRVGRRRAAADRAGRAVPVGVSTLYHRGTLRGGQALHNLGNLVVIGDVNPGAELVASGDIVVFGALRGVAHAGAQGDRSARVIALELAPTQLRIATVIASGDAGTTARPGARVDRRRPHRRRPLRRGGSSPGATAHERTPYRPHLR